MATLIQIGIIENTLNGAFSADTNIRNLTYSLVYDEWPTTDQVMQESQIPKVGDPLGDNEALRVSSKNVESTDNRNVWRINYTYSVLGIAIAEGYAYDFKSKPILRNEAVSGAYWKSNPKEEKEYPRLEKPEYPIIMSTNNQTDQVPETVKVNTSFIWWQIESRAMTEAIDSGEVYQNIDNVNKESVVIAGIKFDAFTIVLKNIEPEPYYLTDEASGVTERRYKTYYTIEKYVPDTSLQILDSDIYALLPPLDNPSETDKNKWSIRRIRLSDLPENSGKISPQGASDQEIEKNRTLDGKGGLLAKDADPVYISYEVKKDTDFNEAFQLATANALDLNKD